MVQRGGGLIEQWGVVTPANRSISAGASVTFPLAFPSACFGVVPTIETLDGAGLLDMAPGTDTPTTTGVNLYAGTTHTEATESRTFGWRWRAIGF